MECNDLVDPHDALYTVFAALLTGFTQVQKYPRSAIDSMTRLV
jgi:hypothetical protein